jgi:hypothetical protein
MVTPRRLRSLIGLMTFAMHYIPYGRANTRPFQWVLKSIWDWDEAKLDNSVNLPEITGFRDACARWMSTPWVMRGVPMHRVAQDFTLHTDASGSGWGATLTSQSGFNPRAFAGRWDPQSLSLHSNCKELLAVDLAIRHAQVSRVLIQVHSDNTTVVAVLNRQGTVHSRRVQEIAYQLFFYLQTHNVQVRAAHIPGVFNKQADMLSRPDKIYSTEWALDRAVFRNICDRLHFSPLIDAFATAANAQLPIFYSPVPDITACGVDAFNHSWEDWCVYLFPPFVLMPQVVQKMASSRGLRALLIFPAQPRRAWYPGLMALPHSSPVPLPLRRTLLTQPHSAAVHPRLRLLNLHAAVFSVK